MNVTDHTGDSVYADPVDSLTYPPETQSRQAAPPSTSPRLRLAARIGKMSQGG